MYAKMFAKIQLYDEKGNNLQCSPHGKDKKTQFSNNFSFFIIFIGSLLQNKKNILSQTNYCRIYIEKYFCLSKRTLIFFDVPNW